MCITLQYFSRFARTWPITIVFLFTLVTSHITPVTQRHTDPKRCKNQPTRITRYEMIFYLSGFVPFFFFLNNKFLVFPILVPMLTGAQLLWTKKTFITRLNLIIIDAMQMSLHSCKSSRTTSIYFRALNDSRKWWMS